MDKLKKAWNFVSSKWDWFTDKILSIITPRGLPPKDEVFTELIIPALIAYIVATLVTMAKGG